MQGKSTDPFKRHKTRHRGITYRERADGSRTYYVYAAGRQHAIQGGERDALAKQAELRGKLARGERVVTANRLFRELAEEWFEAKKPRLRPRVAAGYRTSLDLYVLPAVGDRKLGQVTVQAVAELARELEAKGLTRATVLNHLKPIRASFAYAIRRGMASYNPVDQLEPDPSYRQRARARRGYRRTRRSQTCSRPLPDSSPGVATTTTRSWSLRSTRASARARF
jgi:hypothetical protein